MFFTKNKPTEPICFILFKKLCSLCLVVALFWYLIMQFLENRESVSRPNLTFKNEHLMYANGTFLINYITIDFCHVNTILIINCKRYSNERDEKCNETEKGRP